MKPCTIKTLRRTITRRTANRIRADILQRLFPEGIREVEIWNGFVVLLKKNDAQHLSVERLKAKADKKFKLKRRIERHFPGVAEQMYIISNGDLVMLRDITQATWNFSDSHEKYARDAIVIHGETLDDYVLDWAAQSVITMLLRHIKVTITKSGEE